MPYIFFEKYQPKEINMKTLTKDVIKERAKNTLEKIKDLLYKGHINRIKVDDENNETVIHIPLNFIIAALVFAPFIVIPLYIAGTILNFTFTVKQKEPVEVKGTKENCISQTGS